MTTGGFQRPLLVTERLQLRPVVVADTDALWRIWREADVRRYLFDDREVTRELAAEVLADCLRMADAGLGLWVLSVTSDPTPVGCAGLLRITKMADYDPTLAGMVEVMAALAPSVWGRGYAHEGLSRLIAHGAAALGLSELAAVCDIPNEPSNRMVRRLGFEPQRECEGPRYRIRTYRRRLTSTVTVV